MARCLEHLSYRSHVCLVNFMIIDLLLCWEACLGNKMPCVCMEDGRWSRNCVAWCLYSHEPLYIAGWSFELANSFSARSLDFSLPCSRCVLHADRPGNGLQLFRTNYALDKPSGELTWFLFSGRFPAHSLQCFVPLDSTTPQPAPHCISPPRSYSP